jgi:Raf kinase inhibitor-like YbhB/YbcL family protein
LQRNALFMTPPTFRLRSLAFLAAVLAGGCRPSINPQDFPALPLQSASIIRENIPAISTCDGQNASPQFSWIAPPERTQSLALLAIDRDSPLDYEFVHWVVYNIPPVTRSLPLGLPGQETLPDGSRQGVNDFGNVGFAGPCPPGKSAHHYEFTIYALDMALALPSRPTRRQVLKAMKGHVLAVGQMVGTYQH